MSALPANMRETFSAAAREYCRANRQPPPRQEPQPRFLDEDTFVIAADAVLELAALLNAESVGLVAAASAVDPAAIEARLWTCRRALTAAIAAWRDFVPPAAESEAAS